MGRIVTETNGKSSLVPANIWWTIWKEGNYRCFDDTNCTLQKIKSNCIFLFFCWCKSEYIDNHETILDVLGNLVRRTRLMQQFFFGFQHNFCFDVYILPLQPKNNYKTSDVILNWMLGAKVQQPHYNYLTKLNLIRENISIQPLILED